MDDLIRGLTPEQAREVIIRLSRKGGDIEQAVLAEAKAVWALEAAPREIDRDHAFANAMDEFISQRCPKFAKRLIRQEGQASKDS